MFVSDVKHIAVFGGIGIGLVWGWLVALSVGRIRLVTLLSIGLASLFLVIEVIWLLGFIEMIAAVSASLLSFTICAVWRLRLQEHLNNHSID